MKVLLAILAAALFLPLLVPSGSGQAPADTGVRLLEDKDADVKVHVNGQTQDTSRWAAADLRGLDVKETPEQLTITLTVASLAGPTVPFVEDVQYFIGFRHHDLAYRAVMQRRTALGDAWVDGHLETYNPARHAYQWTGPYFQPTQDLAAGTLAFTLERTDLVDREGDAPHPEVPFTDWQATAQGNTIFGSSQPFCIDRGCSTTPFPSAEDRMPDSGNGTLPLVLMFGIGQSGHARLLSDAPTRASNGEATTIVYQVQAANRGHRNETFALTAAGVPAAWNVRLPAQRVAIPANSTVTLPVLLSVPFAHQHGTYQKFLLELTSLVDAGSVGRIELGIRYSNPPQPAGHHNVLWLHTGRVSAITGQAAIDGLLQGNGGVSMNALMDDPLDSKADTSANTCNSGLVSGPSLTPQVPPQATYCWFVPLLPQLELGLDMDLARTGKISIPVKTLAPLPGAHLAGALYYAAPGGDYGYDVLTVANLVSKAPTDLAANSAGSLEADIVPTPDGDYLPYAKGAALYLQLDLVVTGFNPLGFSGSGLAPILQPGGLLTDLPLNEYHDEVAQVFASNSTLTLLADSSQDRMVNPGKAVLFNLTLENHGAAGTFNLELAGTHLPWARLLAPGESVHLGAGQTAAVRVAVEVPASADKGDTADLVLSATSASDLNVRTLARLYAAVDTGKAYADDSGLLGLAQSQAHKSPGPEAWSAALGLLALALLARRRVA